MKRLFFILLLGLALPLCVHAEKDNLKTILANYKTLGGQLQITEETDKYVRMELADSVTIEMYMADNMIVIYTICAPQCSSIARVYNKEWEYLFPLEPPFKSVFPFATFTDKETGRIEWTDNDSWEYK